MKHYKIAVALLITMLVIVAGCVSNPTGQATQKLIQEKEPIKLGSILILSGQGASWGTAAKNGIDMAIKDINTAGGINGRKLTIDHQDDQSDAKKAITAFDYLVNVKNIKIIIGTTWSHTGLPLIQKADNEKVLMISPSLGMAKFNEESDYLFNTWPHDEILSAKLADYVYQKGHRNVAMIGAEQIWVKQQTNAFKNRWCKSNFVKSYWPS